MKVFRANLLFLPALLSMESLLSLTNSQKGGGAALEAGLGPATVLAGSGTFIKGEVLCTVSPLTHTKAEGRERTGHGGIFLNLLLPR